ncbi:MAG: preprotein translocase subunit Sec61beta [Methanomassiliicoccales archaeon]|jgi:preprotein translocase subunit Sec61beta|nr:preprotein translocase subunit Sec61beta [Methanomassiliicoccales archaeon]MDH7508315.1 preprotein translocase subunit Sec61beta [Methanomassiliicoccales archaeon]
MPKKKSEGFQSAAGLIRYFESEDEKAIKINPWFVIGMAIALVVLVELLRNLFPT